MIYLVKEKKQPVTNSKKGSFLSYFKYWRTASPLFKKIVPGLLLFALFNSSDIFLLLVTKEKIGAGTIDIMGASFNADSITIAAYVVYNLVFALASYPMGILADRMGFKKTILFGFVLFAVVYAGFAFNPSISIIFILFSVYGIFAAATEGVIKAWISNMAQKEHTATAIGFYTSCESICAFFASIIAGGLWEYFGSQTTFLSTAFVSIVVCFYFLLKLKTK